MPIETVDVDRLADQTGNLFKSVAILAKRSRQLSTHIKADLDDKLSYFEGFDPELEDPRFQEEQERISIEHELMPQPTEKAIGEMLEDSIYYRDPSDGEEES